MAEWLSSHRLVIIITYIITLGRSDNMIKNRWHLLQRSRSKRIRTPPAASSTASMSSMLEVLGQRHHICSNQDQVACHLNSDDADDDASYITSTDTWSPFSSCSLEIMMDDDLIMVRPNHDCLQASVSYIHA